jgi:hypothetical protein
LLIIQRRDLPGTPEEILIKDPPLAVNNALWGVAVLAILYLF